MSATSPLDPTSPPNPAVPSEAGRSRPEAGAVEPAPSDPCPSDPCSSVSGVFSPNLSEADRSPAAPADAGRSGAGLSGAGVAGRGLPEAGRSAARLSEREQTAGRRSGDGFSGTSFSGTSFSGTGQPSPAPQAAERSAAGQPDANQTDAGRPDSGRSDSGRSDTSLPGAGRSTDPSARVRSEAGAARAYLLVSPCRNEAAYMRRTLDSVIAQSVPPALWVIVDDGSTDETPAILAEYAARHDFIRVVTKPDRGHRAVGPGVIEAFYYGLDQVDADAFPYLCKLDLDLDLPPRYFEILMQRMEADPRIGTCSGKPWFRTPAGRWVSEKCGDEMSVGMTKFYRRTCFRQIGGFVREVMWDAIDCHKARQLGWIAVSWDEPELRFEHLRPMGSSQKSVFTGRRRHGFGQYYMGSDPAFFVATGIYRMAHPPYVLGGLATIQGFLGAWMRGEAQHPDAELRAFIRAYQRRALRVGKARAVAEIEAARAPLWQPPV